MTERSWSALGRKIKPDWGPEHERAVRATIGRRRARRRALLSVTIGVSSALALIAMFAVAHFALRVPLPAPASTNSDLKTAASTPAPKAVETAAPKAVETLTVTQLSPDTVLHPLPEWKGRGYELLAGGARFLVPHDAEHPFIVVASDVVIEDLGTMFTVQYLGADRLRIAVEQGRVGVRTRDTDTNTEVTAGATMDVPTSAPNKKPAAAAAVSSSWRPLAEHGHYLEAHQALRKAGPGAVREDAADLLMAADTARLSGHPAEAVPYLDRIVRSHGDDPRAPLAAFTLGRVLLDELGRPGDAIGAFARARARGGPLAEDALAREVEAASRAGSPARSHELALLYRQLYPNGRRAKAVSKFGGLD